MNAAVRAFVRRRAGNRCEYCALRQEDSLEAPLHVEHIRPRKHGGDDDEANLCLVCISCNLRKGPNLTGLDPDVGALSELFHPRLQSWEEHFYWEEVIVVGKTAVDRTTVWVLDINSEAQLALLRVI